MNGDISLGWEGLAFWLLRDDVDYLVLNPTIFGEIASHCFISLNLWRWELKLRLDIIGFKLTPLDYQSSVNMQNPGHYCHSLSRTQDVGDIKILVETRAKECHIGILGKLDND